jgi:hypothetical protein
MERAEQRFAGAIASFDQLNEDENYPEDAILFTGSSSIRMWRTIERDMYPHAVIQRCFGGSTFPDLVYFAERIIRPHSIQGMVVFVANDILGQPTDPEIGQVLEWARYVVSVARMDRPNLPVFFIAITPTGSRWNAWPRIQQLNLALETYAASDPRLYFIPTARAFLDEQGMPRDDLFMADRLHLNAEGYALWTRLVRATLDAVFGE